MINIPYFGGVPWNPGRLFRAVVVDAFAGKKHQRFTMMKHHRKETDCNLGAARVPNVERNERLIGRPVIVVVFIRVTRKVFSCWS